MISLIQNNNYDAEINYIDENDQPVDLSGYYFNFIVKEKKDCLNSDVKALIDKTVLLTGTDAENGIFYLNILPADTKDLRPTDEQIQYIYQFQISKTTVINTFEQGDNSITTINNNVTSNTNAITSINNQITTINNSITTINGKLLPSGGTTGQVLAKKSGTNYDTEWVTQSSGGGTLDPFNKFTRRRYIYSIGNFQNSQINIATMGFGNSSTNYQFNSGVPVSFVNGKGAFYQYSKFTYKDPTATGTATTGYIAGSVYADTINFLGYGDALFKFGLTSVNDPSCAMFVGLSSGNNSLHTTANDIFNNSFGGGAWAIGFGFEGSDTNLQFFFIRSGSYKYKINFNQFTGNYIASDILAKQAETAISYRMTNKLDSNNLVIGIDLEFYNHNTNRGGKYSLLFSQLNQTHMFIKDQVSFSPMWGFWQNPGFTGVKDIFNLFMVDITN